ncbi:10416_t:CDS:2 [Funneliformis caledonium]|uniref:10416_t:CDS:1 n=1 Tax=Funneliformis caledonium TaxID=1117310 RepID=A0A9N9D0N2_9GLOM|nr:10416_t:CDS:2 [Funneliformis caledonium]
MSKKIMNVTLENQNGSSLNITTRNNEKAVKKNAKRAESEKDAVITSNNKEDAKRNEIKDSDIKGESDAKISMDEYYLNVERIKNMHASLGYESIDPMHHMLEGNRLDESCVSHKKLPIVVEIIANKTDYYCIINVLQIILCRETENNYYLNEIHEFGFIHIIIIGMLLIGTLLYRIIFLECYSHIFNLNMMFRVLWPVRNSLVETATKPWTGKVV